MRSDYHLEVSTMLYKLIKLLHQILIITHPVFLFSTVWLSCVLSICIKYDRELRPRANLWYCRDETDLMPQSGGSDFWLNPLVLGF